MYNNAKNFGLYCQRLDKNNEGKQYIKILLMASGRSDAFTLPYMSKIYIDPTLVVEESSRISVKQIHCTIISNKHRHFQHALPANSENNGKVESIRINCDIPNAIPVSDTRHFHTLAANSLIYFQAVGRGKPTVVILEQLNLSDLHVNSVRDSIVDNKPLHISWRIGLEPVGDVFLPQPSEEEIAKILPPAVGSKALNRFGSF